MTSGTVLVPNITPEDVLPYLGTPLNAANESLQGEIEKAIEQMKAVLRPRYVYQFFGFSLATNGVVLCDTMVTLRGNDIKTHLYAAEKVALMACTLGIESEHLILRYKPIDLMKALILDAVATAFIEKVCDRVEKKILASSDMRWETNHRYSPGYGDFPLETQPELLDLLQAGKTIGVQCSEHFIMFPRKSVTALVGLFSEPLQQNYSPCDNCQSSATCGKLIAGKGKG